MNREVYEQKAKALVAQMTIEEQASQLTYNSPAIKRLNVPAYNWWNEGLHGVARAGTATSFPQAIALAAIFDEDELQQIADVIAEEGRAKYNTNIAENDRGIYKGLTFWSPNVNIFRDPRWGRGHETYGEDPFLTSRLGVAFIKGLQGDGPIMKSAACAKHFAVHSGPEEGRHEFNAIVSDKDLYETYLPAFEACVKEADVEAIMGAYNRTNGEPCCGSYVLLRDILRDSWGFAGHVVSDCWAIQDFHMHHMVTDTAEDSAALALDAGCDLNCGIVYLHVLKALKAGKITEEHITKAAERLFTTRYMLGLFEETPYDQIPYEKVECKEHVDLAIEAARKSMVLLKNDNILPLDKDKIKTIGVIGPNANSRLALKANYYGTSSRYITLLEGIQAAADDDIRVLYSKGCELRKSQSEPLAEEKDRTAEAVTVAKRSDVVVLCVGLDETIEGEEGDASNADASGDKLTLDLPQVQQDLIQKVTETGTPVILCMVSGSSMDMCYSEEHNQAILQVWYPGASGGTALADILFGKTSPSGKLPVTFYKNTDDLPEFTDYDMKNRTYRYYEGTPLYPFGYGLTYGKVKVTDASIQAIDTEKVVVTAKLKNVGEVLTEDVVQVYLKNLESQYAVTNVSLCGFKRVSLNKGEEQEVQLAIPMKSFHVYNNEGTRIIDGSNYELYVGTSMPDERSVELTGEMPIKLTVNL
jgi:Beta-glucosidase-related glycosidases